MRFSLYIARRYLLSKKKHNAVNIISIISAFGVFGGSMAFILVLSVMNGFENVVLSLFNSFNSDIEITAVESKVFAADSVMLGKISDIEGVAYINEVVEEEALLVYLDQQTLATVKGVGPEFNKMSGLDTLIYLGELKLRKGDINNAVLGAGVAYKLSANIYDKKDPVLVYMPNRLASTGDVLNSFNTKEVWPVGFFQIQQEIDEKYVVVPLRTMRSLLDYSNEVTSIEIAVNENSDLRRVINQIKSNIGPAYEVKSRLEQQDMIYKIIRSEKWVTFFILAFILILALFNIIGTLTMLILEKKKDIAVLQSMGASNKLVRKIFILEGLMISFLGAVGGLLLGGILAWIQQQFGIIGLSGADTMVIDAYPVKLKVVDFMLVFITVMTIGFFAAWYPVRKLSKRYLDIKLS